MKLCQKISAVNFSSMSNSVNSNEPLGIANFIDHAVIADANAPVVLCSSEFPAASGTWIVCERAHRTSNSQPNIERESS